MCQYEKGLKGVVLYKCKRNINRAYRLCYTFGVKKLYLLDCEKPEIGNVFSAKGKVEIICIKSLSEIDGKICAMEIKGKTPKENLKRCNYLLIGGENVTITNKMCKDRYGIKTKNNLCLTVDEALAIGLEYIYEED